MMKRLILFLLLLSLAACRTSTVEDGDAFPTRPVATDTATPEPAALEETPEATVASPSTPPTLAPTPTATEDLPEATVVSPTSTTTAPPDIVEAQPIRIQFEPGATTATLTGHIAAAESTEYLARAAAGQHAHIEILSQNNVANFSLVGMSDGQPYKRLENEDRFWDGILPESQDYLIRVRSLKDADYSLFLTIDPLGANVLQPVWPIVDATSGFLMGGSHNGQWLNAFEIMPSLQDGERPYSIYAGSIFEGQLTGSPPVTPLDGPCGGTPAVSFPDGSDTSGKIALVARWEAAPRKPQSLPLDTPVYTETVAELLQAEGIAAPEVQLTSVSRIDLEGDGVDEVLITAARLSGLGDGLPTASAGDYSLVVLRKVINGEATSIPLAISVFTEDVGLADPVQYNLLAMLDLNGNGNLEIVIEGWYYEGRFATVYESTGPGMQAILSVGCRL